MIKFSGSHQDFGIIHGQYLRAAHHNFYTRYNPATLRRQLAIYQKFYPELILEITSAAKVIGLDPNLLLYEDIASFVDNQKRRINQRTHGCTIFAVHEKGRTFVGRNYDWNALTVTPVKSDGFFIDKSWGLDYNLSRFTQFPARSSRHSRPDQSAIFNNLRILPLHKRPHNDLAREVCERVLYIWQFGWGGFRP